jgi:hypothetical protein
MKNILKTLSIIVVSALVLTSCGKKSDNPVPVTPTKLNQTITFGAIPSKSVGDPSCSLSAIASSGLAITFTSSDLAVATVTSTGVVTIVKEGTVTFIATQSGDATFNSATATQTITVMNSHVYKDFGVTPTYIYIFSDGIAFYNSDKTNPVGNLYAFANSTYTKIAIANLFTNTAPISTIGTSNAEIVPFSPDVEANGFLNIAPHIYLDGSLTKYIYIFSNGTKFTDINKTTSAGQLYTYNSGTYTEVSASTLYDNNTIPIYTTIDNSAPISVNNSLLFNKQ